MPRKPQKVKRSTRPKVLTQDGIRILFDGLDIFETYPHGGEFPSGTEAVWEEYREYLLGVWTDAKPGSRPFSWWDYEAPEDRKLLSGDPDSEWIDDLDSPIGQPVCFYGNKQADPPIYENMADYLDRLELWGPGEREAWVEAGKPDYEYNRFEDSKLIAEQAYRDMGQ